jgi:hypothetical protein
MNGMNRTASSGHGSSRRRAQRFLFEVLRIVMHDEINARSVDYVDV